MTAIAVIVNGGGGGIEPRVLMVASLTVATVDGGGNNGIFTTTSYNNDRHSRPHCPRPCPPLDKDQMVGWKARHDASLSSLPWSLLLMTSLSPLAGWRRQERWPWQQARPNPDIHGQKEVGDTTIPWAWSNKNKHKNKKKNKHKINNSGGNVTASTPADSYAHAATAAASA
jgi:hypothetical protein